MQENRHVGNRGGARPPFLLILLILLIRLLILLILLNRLTGDWA